MKKKERKSFNVTTICQIRNLLEMKIDYDSIVKYKQKLVLKKYNTKRKEKISKRKGKVCLKKRKIDLVREKIVWMVDWVKN